LSFGVLTLVLVFLATAESALTQSTPLAAGSQASDTSATAVSAEINVETKETAVVPVIGAGDLLKVGVLGAPESDQEVRVGADGSVVLNFIGPVHVAGLTPEEAQAIITKKLVAGDFFTEPQVSVFAKEYATQGISVLGEVQKPNVYPLLGSHRLFDVLSLAGGTTPKAGQVITITHRDHPRELRTVLLSNDAAKSAEANVEIFPGDTVVVSKAGIVYVVGDVHKPTGVMMENGTQMTVLQAIAMAEGTNPTAALNGAKLIRKTPTGPQATPLELKKILATKSPDIHVQAEDIIFIPSSAVKGAGKRSLEAIIQAAVGVAIYHPY
jgi:polysaccharide export outer membrane protein